MPAPSPAIGTASLKILRELSQQLRTRRKDLRVTAAAAAESAGMSRMTLNRIERGEASVAIGAYLSVISALGLKLELTDASRAKRRSKLSAGKPPAKIRLADYPELKRLAWQLKGSKEISPKEALELYERNWRHVDPKKLNPRERELLQTLLAAFGRERLLV